MPRRASGDARSGSRGRLIRDRQSVPPSRAPRGFAPIPVGLVDAVAVVAHRRLPTRPLQLHPVPLQAPLQAGQEAGIGAHGARACAVVQTESRQLARGLAGRPLVGVQPEAAVGDVGGADVLARRQQVVDPDRQQRPERQLLRPVLAVQAQRVALPRRVRFVHVDTVAAHRYGVRKPLGLPVSARRVAMERALGHGVFGAYAA